MGSRSSGSSTTTSMSPSPVPEKASASKGTAIFSYTCVGLTGVALVAVVVFYCNRHVRSRAPVTAAMGAGDDGGGGGRDQDVRGVADVAAKIPEFTYTGSSGRHGGGDGPAQCSVCLGALLTGEMVRRLPACKHLYHVECIDMWLASHATCPLCRTEVDPPPPPQGDGQQPTPALPPV
ncbi:RING-H2 finger protein ATL39-like [Oryza brachyantha]|uniref:RING-H2 finger protein ATL39-like n=1 Tax=Oryza brachyantha TaxID=4533 RepID=UPI001ADC5A3E|nr:RING-H2 finger protein ATL39-like [Oryza brachyantha]